MSNTKTAEIVSGLQISGLKSPGQELLVSDTGRALWWDKTESSPKPGTLLATYSIGGGYPYYIAYDGTNMWVVDGSFYGSVIKVAPDGTHTSYSLAYADASYPSGIVFDGTHMWIGGNNANTVIKMALDGTYVAFSDPSFDHSSWVAYNSNTTDIWVSNFGTAGAASVSKVTQSGVVTTYPIPAGYLNSITFDGTNMWTVSYASGLIFKVDPTGAYTQFSLTGGTSPYNIEFDGTYLWIRYADTNNVTRFALDGSSVNFPNPAGFTNGYSRFDGDKMGASSQASGQIITFDSNGEYIAYQVLAGNPFGMAFDGQNMWIACPIDQTVKKVAARPLAFSGTPNQGKAIVANAQSGGSWSLPAGDLGGTFLATLVKSINGTTPPATATSPGTPGMIAWDSSGYIYLCIALNTWVRFLGATW